MVKLLFFAALMVLPRGSFAFVIRPTYRIRQFCASSQTDGVETDAGMGDDSVRGKNTGDGWCEVTDEIKDRRQVFADVLRLGSATAALCSCIGCAPRAAHGLAQIANPPPETVAAYDLPRNQIADAMFANEMATGMKDYELEAAAKKDELFSKLFSSLDRSGEDAVIVEVGIGSFPNAQFYAKDQRLHGADIIGIEPNDRMEQFARDSAKQSKLFEGHGDNLRIIHGVSEALPLADNSCDAVVCTLTLCSVVDPERSVEEIKRVLKKPGGKFLFWEHVLSETDPALALQQRALTPLQVRLADGCHLDRRSGATIEAAGFRHLDIEYLELSRFSFLNPTVCGIATV